MDLKPWRWGKKTVRKRSQPMRTDRENFGEGCFRIASVSVWIKEEALSSIVV
jgi:hypothetical protein